MKLKAKRVKDGFLIPLIDELKDKDEIEVEIKEKKSTEFLDFLKKVYSGKENISKITDEEALEDALRDKYGL
jgi:UV DNA damage repair endonuclease